MSALAIVRGPKRVAEVVEAERPQRGGGQHRLLPAAERGPVEVTAGLAGEHKIVVAYPVLAPPELRQRRGDIGSEGHRAHLARLGASSRWPA